MKRLFELSRIPAGHVGVVLLLLAAASGSADGESSGVEQETRSEPIRLGMSTALSGPSAYLGRAVRTGVLAALEEANRGGGIQGRAVELIALDDGYEPSLTVPNMRELTEELGVLAVVCNVGTPTAVAAIPIAMETQTPFWGAYTGAAVLRKQPPDRYVWNFRGSYVEEVAVLIEGLVRRLRVPPEAIAFFTQRDAFGDAVFGAAIQLLREEGLAPERRILHTRFTRNSLAVENAVADLLLYEPEPRAVVLVATPDPAAKFVRLAREHGSGARFLGMSFVGAERFVERLGATADGTVFTQVVPNWRDGVPIAGEFRKAMASVDEEAPPTYTSFEGYVATRIFCRAIESVPGALTREAVVEALESMGEFDVGLGVPLFLGPEEHQASHTVWSTIIRDGTITPLDWAELAAQEGE